MKLGPPVLAASLILLHYPNFVAASTVINRIVSILRQCFFGDDSASIEFGASRNSNFESSSSYSDSNMSLRFSDSNDSCSDIRFESCKSDSLVIDKPCDNNPADIDMSSDSDSPVGPGSTSEFYAAWVLRTSIDDLKLSLKYKKKRIIALMKHEMDPTDFEISNAYKHSNMLRDCLINNYGRGNAISLSLLYQR